MTDKDVALIRSTIVASALRGPDGAAIVGVAIQVGNDPNHSARILMDVAGAVQFKDALAEAIALASEANRERGASRVPPTEPVISAPASPAPTSNINDIKPMPGKFVLTATTVNGKPVQGGHGRTLQLEDLEKV